MNHLIGQEARHDAGFLRASQTGWEPIYGYQQRDYDPEVARRQPHLARIDTRPRGAAKAASE